ncbi:MAG: acetate--CoA ligase [Desulfomonile tiedjei]|uniref:Acetate--CoA ligase n=1 Tax=Desulfomonile tiedjei TaxID=2358 RepID=A0A9D6Z3M0_9BACT|nr:acetate--CoA ligase [Desulfomonile tiedjei]
MNHAPKWYDAHLKKFQQTAHVKGLEEYKKTYRESLENSEGFWKERAEEYLTWFDKWDFVIREDMEEGRIQWFGGGKLNASYNCIDRHLIERAGQTAFHWEGDDPRESLSITYSELYESVNKFAAVLQSRGVRKGDRVVIYLPIIPELPVAMLACGRIGAIHCVVFSGFGRESLAARIQACQAKVVVIADGAKRNGKIIPIKESVNSSLKNWPLVESVIVVNRCDLNPQLDSPREVWWHEAAADPSLRREILPESMDAEDPLFIFYTSLGIGKPRGLVHTHGGYLLWTAMTTRLILDLRPGDIYWCTEDLGLIAGHSLGLYGALLNGVTSVIFEGSPRYPAADRYWEIIAKLRVTKLCTGPSTVRTLAAYGTENLRKHDLSSLEILASSGQRMSQEAWEWLYYNVGGGRCPIMDAWWQTEAGGPMVTSLPGVAPLKPGSVSFPFFGVDPVILDLDTGEETRFPNQEGAFFIRRPWPGMARTVFGDQEEYRDSYYAPFPGLFITRDGAKRDEDGYYWMTGRIDDVINVSGRRVGAWEIEAALGSHPAVNEATAVGFPHPIKGQGIYLFITLHRGYDRSDELKDELTKSLRDHIGVMALPDALQWADALPKTRSGKILRRLLQKIAAGQVEDLGDTTTVADPRVLEPLIRNRIGFP